MAPRFWMEEISLTTTSFARMACAALRRQIVTMTGSICGVMPTATEMENSSASSQSPLVRPAQNEHDGAHDEHEPHEHAGDRRHAGVEARGGRGGVERACDAAQVGARTGGHDDARARTALHGGAREGEVLAIVDEQLPSDGVLDGGGVFSTRSDSPVRAAWVRNRFLAETMRRSAG